jgi:single-strand DNA-binding protein
MAFEVEGRLHRVYPTEQKSGSFQAREFVVEVPDGNYPQMVKFQAVQERCAQLDDFREGEQVKVHFDLRGREWQGKYFTNLTAFRIERVGEGGFNGGGGQTAAQADPSFPADPFPNYTDAPANTSGGDLDGLPF